MPWHYTEEPRNPVNRDVVVHKQGLWRMLELCMDGSITESLQHGDRDVGAIDVKFQMRHAWKVHIRRSNCNSQSLKFDHECQNK